MLPATEIEDQCPTNGDKRKVADPLSPAHETEVKKQSYLLHRPLTNLRSVAELRMQELFLLLQLEVGQLLRLLLFAQGLLLGEIFQLSSCPPPLLSAAYRKSEHEATGGAASARHPYTSHCCDRKRLSVIKKKVLEKGESGIISQHPTRKRRQPLSMLNVAVDSETQQT